MLSLAHKFLLTFDPETSHDLVINSLHLSQRTPLQCFYKQRLTPKPVTVAGITFDNPVGLAAGLDKNGECIDAFAAMGFGFIEVGTVTPRPQPGNPKPRIFRIPEKEAIINRLGFNNKGVDYLVSQVKRAQFSGPIGINIGKNKDTPEDDALSDYSICLQKVYPLATYVTVNISSPNTPGLRNLQYGEALSKLLDGLKQQQLSLAQQHGRYVPLFVKIAPDLSHEQVVSIADTIVNAGMDGVIATNTTLERSPVEGLAHAEEAGGLSGKVLAPYSLEVTKILSQTLQGRLPIIGVGGVDSGHTAKARLDAGASLLQVYTGFIYQGPEILKRILSAL